MFWGNAELKLFTVEVVRIHSLPIRAHFAPLQGVEHHKRKALASHGRFVRHLLGGTAYLFIGFFVLVPHKQSGREKTPRNGTQFKNECFGDIVVQKSVRRVPGRETGRFGSWAKLLWWITPDLLTSHLYSDAPFSKQLCG